MNQRDYVDILKREYRRAVGRNPYFSMNAHARYLGLAPSHYNDVINRRCGLSLAKAKEICRKLEVSDIEAEIFNSSVLARHSRSKQDRLKYSKQLAQLLRSDVTQMKLDLFSVIADWYHLSILELTRLDHFVPDHQWIAQQLRISEVEVEEAVERLKKLGLLRVRGRHWTVHKGLLKTTDDIPSQSIQRYHSQMLERAKSSLALDAMSEREFNSVVFACAEDQVPLLKKRIRDFQVKLNSEFETRRGKRNRIYCVAVQLFPISSGNRSR